LTVAAPPCTLRVRMSDPAKRSASRGFRQLALGAALLFACCACGASLHVLEEGTLRFEHCYRLDLNAETATPHRRACWQEWVTSYTYGQSRDRIEYARRRVRSLAVGDPARPELHVEARRKPEERQFYLSVPSAGSPHSPPAPIATRAHVPPDAGNRPQLTTDDCASACRAALQSCRVPCAANDAAAAGAAPRLPDACSGCELDYKRCMVRCYQ